MIDTVAMRPGLVSVVAGVPHDQSSPVNWSPAQTPNHGAGARLYTQPGAFTFIVPYWVTSVRRRAWGGGGSGGGSSSGAAASGGVGGWMCEDTIDVEPGQVFTGTVGAGGVAVDADGPGVVGGSSTINGAGTDILAPGGNRGNSAVGVTPGATATGTNGATAVGTIIRTGGNGGAGFAGNFAGGGGSSAGTAANGNAGTAGTNDAAGVGGAAPTGGGAGSDGSQLNEPALNASAPGGGGGGTSVDPGPEDMPGAGGDGQVEFAWEAVTEEE